MDFEQILQMSTSQRNLALYQNIELVDDVSEFLAVRQLYSAAIKQVRTKLEILNDGFQVEHCRNPIHHIESRLKPPGSILEKLRRKGYPIDLKSLREGILDFAGVRVVCSYLDDVELISGLLLAQDGISLLKRKDYISAPKPNGYRSLHLVVLVQIQLANANEYIPVEIQIRTIAMDYWAGLEHQMKYKAQDDVSASLKSRLKHDADLLSAIDADLQDIYCQLKDQGGHTDMRPINGKIS